MTNQNTVELNMITEGASIEQVLDAADGSVTQAIEMLDAVNLTLEQRLAGVSVE